MNNNIIEWLDIPSYWWAYKINSEWIIITFKWKKAKELQQVTNYSWYKKVKLCLNGKVGTFKVHRLVMETFKGKSKLQVNHIDWVKDNNSLSNLEYCTNQENQDHRWQVLNREKLKEES